MTRRRSSADHAVLLKTLLDALEAEILASSDEDVLMALADIGQLQEAALHEIRVLLAAGPDTGAGAARLHPGNMQPSRMISRHRSPPD